MGMVNRQTPSVSVYKKRSFLRLPITIDVPRLLADYHSIPASEWGASHWDVHCSIDMVELRGGGNGRAEDYLTYNGHDTPLLARLPYISSLLAKDGPFGGAIIASIARTKPFGISRVHDDGEDLWAKTVRLHIPIVTNPGALFLSERMAIHFSVGHVWTFDNQAQHGVVNGDGERTHIMCDIVPNPVIAELLRNATFEPGVYDEASWIRASGPRAQGRVPPILVATAEPLSTAEKEKLGLNPKGFAARVLQLTKKGALTLTPLRKGDIVVAVNGVDQSVLSRTAVDHIRVKHEPGETVTLDILRNGASRQIKLKLWPDDFSMLGKPQSWKMLWGGHAPKAETAATAS